LGRWCHAGATPQIEELHGLARDFECQVRVAHRHGDRRVAEQILDLSLDKTRSFQNC
jgi:hypothetical protein